MEDHGGCMGTPVGLWTSRYWWLTGVMWCTYIASFGTLKCENAAICEKVATCEKNSTLNVKIDAICEKTTLNVKKLGSLNVSNISTLNVFKSTLYVQTLFWRYLWKSNFSACQILRLTISYMPRINHNYSNLQPNDNNALVWLDICTCGRAFRRVPWTDASSRPLNTQTMPILQQTVWDEAIKICIQLDES